MPVDDGLITVIILTTLMTLKILITLITLTTLITIRGQREKVRGAGVPSLCGVALRRRS
jgi:hypothetical protein